MNIASVPYIYLPHYSLRTVCILLQQCMYIASVLCIYCLTTVLILSQYYWFVGSYFCLKLKASVTAQNERCMTSSTHRWSIKWVNVYSKNFPKFFCAYICVLYITFSFFLVKLWPISAITAGTIHVPTATRNTGIADTVALKVGHSTRDRAQAPGKEAMCESSFISLRIWDSRIKMSDYMIPHGWKWR